MGMLKGSSTFTKFRTTQPMPSDWRERLEHRAHVPRPDARTKEPYGGWVALDDETKAPADPIYGSAFAFACRIDRKRVPARALKLAVEARQREVMQERGLERLNRNHRQEIAEAVEEDLLGQAQPTITVVDVLVTGSEVWVFTATASQLDIIRGLFHDTFGARLYPDRLSDWLADALGWADTEAACRSLPGGSAAGGRAAETNHEGWHEHDPMSGREVLVGSGFLGHLLSLDQNEDAGVWLDGRVQFDDLGGEGKSRTVLDGTIGVNGVEAAESEGKRPVLARFVWRQGETETHGTLKVTPAGLVYKSVKLPIDVREGIEEMVLERAYLLDRWHTAVREAFVGWFTAPGTVVS